MLAFGLQSFLFCFAIRNWILTIKLLRLIFHVEIATYKPRIIELHAGFSAFDSGLITNDRGGTMNGTATITATEDHQHQQAQNEPTSEHPRSPASPLSVRHGEMTLENVFKILS